MFGSTILDVATGIIFVFLLVSLFASTLNEIVLSLMNMRGRDLMRGLKELLNDKQGTGLVQKLYSHGLIYGLYRGEYVAGKGGNLPSYIPSRSFALALMDLISNPSNPESAESAPVSGAKGATCAAVPTDKDVLAPLRNAALHLDPKVRATLIAMIDAAENDPSNLRQNLENWFNSTMDRVSGWYKYRTQWFLFWIGLALAVSMNIDSLEIARHLSTDTSLRQALVAAATDAAKQPLPEQSAKPEVAKDAAKPPAHTMTLQEVTAKIETLGLPIGWPLGWPSPPVDTQNGKSGSAPMDWYFALLQSHLGGWLLTALAASLGAPFWFDILNKFMVVRSTVKPREKSHEEKSKET